MKSSPDKNQVSVHRAFIYSAAVPGWGEYYSGSPFLGAIKFILLMLFGVWFFLDLIDVATGYAYYLSGYLKGNAPGKILSIDYLSLGISFIGVYFTWFWAMISSVDVAVKNRQQNNLTPQSSLEWGVFFSWLCPGSGQVYIGFRSFGYILFVIYLIGILLIIPVYTKMGKNLADIMEQGNLSGTDPFAVITIVKGLFAHVNYSFAKLLQIGIKFAAIAKAAKDLRDKWTPEEPALRYIILFAIGWLCPGSGQIVQGRDKTGWGLLIVYFGFQLVTVILFVAEMISFEISGTLAWGPILVKWYAMLEAPAVEVFRGDVTKKNID